MKTDRKKQDKGVKKIYEKKASRGWLSTKEVVKSRRWVRKKGEKKKEKKGHSKKKGPKHYRFKVSSKGENVFQRTELEEKPAPMGVRGKNLSGGKGFGVEKRRSEKKRKRS